MADWIIPCNPQYYDIAGSFEKLDSVDWRQSAKNIMPGDTVYIYVGRPVQAIAFSYVVLKTMIPPDKADFSDAEFERDDSLEPYSAYMRLKPVCRIPLNALTFDRMREAGLKGNIQGPRLVPEELRELFEAALRVSEMKDFTGTVYQDKEANGMDIKNSDSVLADPQKRNETAGEAEAQTNIESQVNARVREEFMRQIREKTAELAKLDTKRENLRKEITLLEGMLAKL